MDDMELVREYAQRNSEPAFAELVSRHINLVYSVALRQVRDPHLAEEITQAVFVILARKASSLGAKTILSGWLCRTARYVSADALKGQRRRQNREQEAYMQSSLNEAEASAWTQIAPVLDAAMANLEAKDHDAIVLRYFERRDLKDVAAALGASEAAAQRRVNRAVEKLRKFFTSRGVILSAAIIASVVTAKSVQAAPTELSATIARGGVAGAATSSLATAILKKMLWAKIKTVAMLTGTGIAVVATVVFAVNHKPSAPELTADTSVTVETNSPAPAAPVKAARPKYRLAELQAVSGFQSLRVFGLNNFGQLVGAVDSTNHRTHAFLWENGTMKDLGTFGGRKCIAMGINDAGDIVGTILTNDERRAFLSHHGEVSNLGTFDNYAKLGDEGDKYNGGPGIIYYAPPVTLNNRMQVTGNIGAGGGGHSFIFDGGQPVYFGALKDASIFYPEQINNHGEILGRSAQRDGKMHAKLWRDGEMIDLDKLEGSPFHPNALNDSGTVVGWIDATNGAHAIVWENGKSHRLDDGNCKSSRATAINNHGVVVGYARSSKNVLFACVWIDGEMLDLNNYVKLPTGWRLGEAEAINERGQMVVKGGRKGKGSFTCLLSPSDLTPVPQMPVVETVTPVESPVAPFYLTSSERLADGRFRLQLAGQPGARYLIEASTNLTTWENLGDAANSNGRIEFVDQDAAKFTLRFYRAVQAP